MRLLMHNLLKIIKLYLIQKKLETDETQMQILLARAMKQRGLDVFFEKELIVAKETHQKQGFRHAHFHYLNYRLAEEELEHIMLLRRQGDIQLTPWSRSLTTSFAAETLRQAAIGVSMEDVSKQVFDAPMLESVLQLVENGYFGDILSNLASRALLLRIYFETDADDALASLCDSFQTFLSRQKALNNQKDSYLNLIRFVRKIMRSDLRNPLVKQQIHDEMAQTTYLAGRNWLMQKVSF